MSIKKKPDKKAAPKKPTTKAVVKKADKVVEVVENIQEPKVDEAVALNELQYKLVESAIQQSAAVTSISSVLYTALQAPESPLYNIIQGTTQLQQLVAGLVQAQYVPVDTHQKLTAEYNRLYAAYQQATAQVTQLQNQNQALTNALHNRTVNQQQPMIGV